MIAVRIKTGTDVARLPPEALGLQGREPGMDCQLGQRRKDGVTRRMDFRTTQFVVTAGYIIGAAQYELGNRLAVTAAHRAVGLAHYVQDNVVVGRIRLVSVLLPKGGTVVQFHVAHPQHAVQLQLGIEEVGACIGVGQAGIDDFHPLAVSGAEFLQRENLVFPKVM